MGDSRMTDRKPGRPISIQKSMYIERFNLSPKKARLLTSKMIEWPDGCADDSARWLLLGISQKFTPKEQAALRL